MKGIDGVGNYNQTTLLTVTSRPAETAGTFLFATKPVASSRKGLIRRRSLHRSAGKSSDGHSFGRTSKLL